VNEGDSTVLVNPFTPAAIASSPDDFFGREEELRNVESSLQLGSVVLDGPIGIGKSSLLSQALLAMEGFGADRRAKSVIAIGHRDINTVDDAALLLLQQFVEVDESQRSVSFKVGVGLPKVLGAEYTRTTNEIFRNFNSGRHLSALQRIVQRECLPAILGEHDLLLLCIDEADKCPIAIARLVRAIVTSTQHQGVNSVRFVLAGVSPFFQAMVSEDAGIRRFFYKNITVKHLTEAGSTDLLETKLASVAREAEKQGARVRIHPKVISRVVELSAGHPHILQLLGSHLVEHENEDPDGVIDSNDLANSLRRICYEDRAQVYESVLHTLEMENRLEPFVEILTQLARGFPTRIEQRDAVDLVGRDAIQWLVEHNVLAPGDGSTYGLVDEFLRIRMLLDNLDKDEEIREVELDVLRQFAARSSYDDDPSDEEADDVRIVDEE
jgi:hypothetical protein